MLSLVLFQGEKSGGIFHAATFHLNSWSVLKDHFFIFMENQFREEHEN